MLLPRLSLLYKINQYFTTRIGGGLGYKTPSVFSDEPDERDLQHIALSGSVKPERSQGINWDINYKKRLGEITLNVNQMFFITQVNRPLVIDTATAIDYYINAGRPIRTSGIETYVQVRYDELDVYLGYAYTVAKQLYNASQPNIPLSARSKFAAVVSNEFSSRFRTCVEASFTGRQYLDAGKKSPGYFISNAMIRYDIKNISFTLNGENLFDYRQNKKESVVLPPFSNPVFRPVWGPIDGRVFNLSAKISW
jgi:outer membrane receptor protein involved in Fe transport